MRKDKAECVRHFVKTLQRFEIVDVFDEDHNISHKVGYAVRLYVDLMIYWDLKNGQKRKNNNGVCKNAKTL